MVFRIIRALTSSLDMSAFCINTSLSTSDTSSRKVLILLIKDYNLYLDPSLWLLDFES